METKLTIPQPCAETWVSMTASEHGRHCSTCDRVVVDTTQLPMEDSARRLVDIRRQVRQGSKVCIRSNMDPTGRLIPTGSKRRLLTNGLSALLSMTLAGCHGHGPDMTTASDTTSKQTIQRMDSQPQPSSTIERNSVTPDSESKAVMGMPIPEPVDPSRSKPPLPIPDHDPVSGTPSDPVTNTSLNIRMGEAVEKSDERQSKP